MKKDELKSAVTRIAKSRATLAIGLTLVLWMMAQSTLLGIVEADAGRSGAMLGSLEMAKARLLFAAFPAPTAQYLQPFPLRLLGAMVMIAAIVPLVLVVLGSATLGRRERIAASRGPVLDRPTAEFAALWSMGFGISAVSIAVVCASSLVIGAPDAKAAFFHQCLALVGLSAFLVLPATGIVIAIASALRSRLAVCAFGIGFVLLSAQKSLPAAAQWLSPRTYQNYSLSMTWAGTLLGITGLVLWGGAGLALALWNDRRRRTGSPRSEFIQGTETMGRAG